MPKIKNVFKWVNGVENIIYPASLPFGYQEVEWIGSSATQYINTGYTPNVNTEIETDLSWGGSQTTRGVFFGVTSNDQWSDGILGRIYDTNTGIFNPRFCNAAYAECQISATIDTFHKVILKKNYCTLDGVAGTMTTSGTPYQNNIYLFCGDNGGSAWRHTTCKFKSFKISESGKMVKNFVPCYRKSDNVIGMYETIGGQFYTNSGTGTFTKGQDIINISQIQTVQYIEGSGTQWIDTLVTAKETTKSQIKVRPLGVTGSTIYGYCGNNDSADYRLFNYSNQIYWDLYSYRAIGSTFSSGTDYEFEIGNNYVKNVGASSNLVTGTTVSSYTSAGTIKLNYHDDDGAISSNRRYYVKIWEGDTQIRDLIPCYKKSDNTIGLYDKINKIFYANSGSGTFIKGPNV